MTNDEHFTYDQMERRIAPKGEAHEEGIADGTRNFPDRNGSSRAPFREKLVGRAKTEITAVTKSLQAKLNAFFEMAQTFAVDPNRAQKECVTRSNDGISSIEEVVNRNRISISEARMASQTARRARILAFDTAGAPEPTHKLDTWFSLLAIALLVIASEGTVAYWILIGTIEPLTAFVSGMTMPLIMYLLGAAAGFLWLAPMDKTQRLAPKHIAKLALAGFITFVALFLVAVMVAWRSALISGLDATPSEVWEILIDWRELVSLWETGALFALAGISYIVAFFKLRRFFLGFDPDLRAYEKAWRDAERERVRVYDEAATNVVAIGATGRRDIDGIVEQRSENAQQLGRGALSLKGDIMKANQWIDVIRNVVDSADARYQAANDYGRSEPAPEWRPLEIDLPVFGVPEEIDATAQKAAETCEMWREAADAQCLRLADAEFNALSHLQVLADPSIAANDRLQATNPSLPWRAA